MKAKRFLTVLLATAMAVVTLTACGGDAETAGSNTENAGTEETVSADGTGEAATPVATVASVDFEDGNCGFVKMNLLKGSPDESLLSVVDYNGSKALYAENVSGKAMFIGINVSALLGDQVADLSTITMDIGTEAADGSFAATSGYLYAYAGEGNEEVKCDAWSVYLETQNPKTATFDVSGVGFVAGADNYILLSKETDNNATAASMYLDNITFLDAEGNVLTADTTVDFGSPAGFESAGTDLSNLCAMTDVVTFEGFETSGDAWSQAGFTMPQEVLDALVPGSVVQIEYTSETGDMWIVMNEAEAGWSRVGVGNIDGSESSAAYINNSKNICQVTYEQIAEKCGEDVSTWGSTMQCEASGAWQVFSVKVGQRAPHYAVADAVTFEGFETKGDAWSQAGFTMPQEVLDALVPGSIVEISYTSETGDMWIVMNEAEAGWSRVGVGNIDGSGSSPAVFDGSKCYVTYEQIAEKCGDDVSTWGSTMQCESSGAWEVYGVKVGTAVEFQMVNTPVVFEGFETKGDAWSQAGFTMPQEILDALVPGAVVEITYTSETGDMRVVMNEAEAGWSRVGVGNIDGSASSPAAFDGMTCQVTYEQIAEKCGDDVSTWGSTMQCESSGAWEVYSVAVWQNVE